MKIAIVHDFISEYGGADRVLQILAQLYPQAHIYTAYANYKMLRKYLPSVPAHQIHTSWAQHTFLSSHKSLFQCLSPFIWRSFRFNNYDLVLSHSAHLLSNIINVKESIHIQYIQTPPKNLFGLLPKTPLQRIVPYTFVIAKLYRKALRSTPYVITNSFHMKKILHDIAHINPEVIYPPVHIPSRLKRTVAKHYLCVSRLDKIKNLELAILACTQLQLPLKIVGKSASSGYEKFLRSIAGPTVKFLGFKQDSEIERLYESAKAFIFPSLSEDFGIAPIEAMAHGVPVIAYFGGGVKETVINGKTGIFYYRNTVDSLKKALLSYDPKAFSPISLNRHATRFSEERFKKEFSQYVQSVLSKRKTKRL